MGIQSWTPSLKLGALRACFVNIVPFLSLEIFYMPPVSLYTHILTPQKRRPHGLLVGPNSHFFLAVEGDETATGVAHVVAHGSH